MNQDRGGGRPRARAPGDDEPVLGDRLADRLAGPDADADETLDPAVSGAAPLASASGSGDDPLAQTTLGGAVRAPGGLYRGDLVGRHVVLSQVGEGGMSVVYMAYDPELDRKIALKLLALRRDDGPVGRARLLREAQAMAQLSHPNVVGVHDVGVHLGRVYLAMEFVDGPTLRGWAAAGRRRWREVLAMYMAAGAGLQAAHAVGLVHRDFKPDNVMVGADGRPRVMDFGLARADADPPASREAAATLGGLGDAGVLATPLTRTGALMGTPRYMAPEQWQGGAADPRTDVFAFCVALWEALHGQTPFAGDEPLTLMRSVLRGEIRAPPAGARVPGWVRRILRRGLAVDPAARWPSMAALLGELGRDPTPRLRLLALCGGLALIAAIVVGGRWAATRRVIADCAAEGAKIDGDWGDEARAAMRAAFLATGKSYASTTYDHTAPWFDRWADAWRSAATGVCEAHRVDGTWDAELHARAVDCLDEARGTFTALVQELSRADETALAQATTAAARLTSAAACTRPEALRERPRLRVGQWGRVRVVRGLLARAASREAAGAYQEGLRSAREALAAAELLASPAMITQAAIRVGSLAERAGEYEEAEASLRRALVAAREARAARELVTIASELVFVVGYLGSRTAEGKVWAEAARNELALLAGDHPLERADLANNLAGVHFVAGEYSEAIRLYREVREIREATLGADHPRVADSINNLASLHYARAEYDEAERLYARTLAIYEDSLGPEHPLVAMALNNLSLVLDAIGEHEGAARRLRRALAIREAALGPDHPNVATTLGFLADNVALGGDPEEAKRMYARVLDIYGRSVGEGHPSYADALSRLALIHRRSGDREEAIRLYLQALKIHEAALGEGNVGAASELQGLGDTYLELGRPAEAAAMLERALAIREAHELGAGVIAETRFSLARALWDGGGDKARARRLAEAAAAVEEGTREGAKARAEVEAWLAERDRGAR